MTKSTVLDHFFKICLIPSSHWVYVAITAYCLLTKKFQRIFNTLYWFSFSQLINAGLKVFFHMPLPEHIHHPGFAFPSGHTQAILVLYGMLFCHLKWRWCFVAAILLSVGSGLLYFHYHTLVEISGATVVQAFCCFMPKKHMTTHQKLNTLLTPLLLFYVQFMFILSFRLIETMTGICCCIWLW